MRSTHRLRAGVLTTSLMLTASVAFAAPSNPRFASPTNFEDKMGQRFIITFSDMKQGTDHLREVGAHVAHAFPKRRAVAAYVPERALEGLRHKKWVTSIEADVPRWPMAQTTPYGITMVEALQVADTSSGNTTVCIIDSGYALAHEDLQDNNVSASPNSGSGNPYEDGCGHGSHVAGTIAALDNTSGVIGVNRNGNLHLHIVRCSGTTARGPTRPRSSPRSTSARRKAATSS